MSEIRLSIESNKLSLSFSFKTTLRYESVNLISLSEIAPGVSVSGIITSINFSTKDS